MSEAQTSLQDRQIDRSQMKVTDEVAIEISDMNKWYGTFHVLRDINLTVNRGGADCYLRSLRFWQVDPDPLHQCFGRTSKGPDHG